MANQIFRVGGGYTSFAFGGKDLLYVDQIADQAPQPVAQPEPVQPLDARHPIEIAFPKAHGPGTLTVTIREQWYTDVWEQLPGFAGAVDIIDVFERNIRLGSITCVKKIRLPNGRFRSIKYHNTVVTNVDDSETVAVGTITMPKTITMMYTHKTKS